MHTEQNAEAAGREFPMVAVGASAGGLEAFLEFFRALPTPTGMAFFLVTHLQPTYESQLVSIVGDVTRLKVVEATDQARVERDHLYILPPNSQMTIHDGTLQLQGREGQGPHYPIDLFFDSVARDQGRNVIGIVLSGMGSDGAQGLRSIKSHNGIALCQAPETAQHTGMPNSALATGAVDIVLRPGEMAKMLMDLRSRTGLPEAVADGEFDKASDDFKDFRRILALLKASHSVEFMQYKPSTVSRRINRRAVLHHCRSLSEYLHFLENNSFELNELYRDILISVTSFFREPQMFEALAALIRPTLKDRQPLDAYRVWVAGCATGEEVYSLGIALHELIEESGKQIPFQIFGTDISDIAIERARNGVYNESLQSEVSTERLQRYFTRIDSGFRIAESIRQNCIFARHDLTADPPFSQMDLVTCRNVLIYLGSDTQSRIVPTLHYCLKPGGLLVLGSAETIGQRGDLFSPTNNEYKIYTKKLLPGRLAMDFNVEPGWRGFSDFVTPLQSPGVAFVDLEIQAARVLRDMYAPAAVIVNQDLQVLHFHGHTSLYLTPTPGEASLNLLRLAHESLIYPLRNLLDRALEARAPVERTAVQVEQGGETRELVLRVIPLSERTAGFLVIFEPASKADETAVATPEAAPLATAGARAGSSLEIQLAHAQLEIKQMRDQLRRVIEQHEVANEELRAANEEARSSNEELQSTNEELRTAKEELQSSNEELTTVNDELKHRNDELRVVTDDLTNVLSASAIPIVMVDLNRRLRSFTPAAEELLALHASDMEQPITEVRYAFSLPHLNEMLDNALTHLRTGSERAQSRRGRWYEVFVRPYRTADNRINGAIITLIDIDASTRALEQMENARNFAEGIVETVQHPLLVLDQNLRILRATDAFYRTFNLEKADAEGHLFSELGNRQWQIPELNRLMETALIRNVPFRDLDIEHEFAHLGRRTMRLNARRIVSSSEHRLLLAIEDVTDRKETAEIQYRRLFESARDAIVIVEAYSGTVADVNPYFTELTRYQRQDVISKPLWNLDLFQSSEEVRLMLPQTRKAKSCRYESVNVLAADGTELILELIANLYRVRENEFVQLNIRDVTERRRMEQRLQSSNLDLQQFAFAASHDLQEPLRTLTAFSEMLKQRVLGNGQEADAKTVQYLEFITGSADRMRSMVLDLLNYSQIARAEFKPSEVNAEAALSSVLMNLQMAIHQSNARVTFEPLPTVVIEPTHLTQLFQNLIGNAIKYASDSPPLIHVSGKENAKDFEFCVKDNGIGIEPQYQEYVFTIFKRLHGSKYPGSGVGLAICKRIIDRYGGTIRVDSVVGEGSKFCFTIPKHKLQSN